MNSIKILWLCYCETDLRSTVRVKYSQSCINEDYTENPFEDLCGSDI